MAHKQLTITIGISRRPETIKPAGLRIGRAREVTNQIGDYPSLRLYLEEKGPVRDEKEMVKGVSIWCYVYKSKIDNPYRSCLFTLDFDYGIDNIIDCVKWLRESTTLLGGKKEWYSMPGHSKK